jgi:uncharacterized protein YPO0396
MSSVLNVGVMRGNPVGNQIRSLQTQIDTDRKNMQMLLTALEQKAPEVHAEYMRMREAEQQAAEAAVASVEQQQQQRNPVPSRPAPRNPGGRF